MLYTHVVMRMVRFLAKQIPCRCLKQEVRLECVCMCMCTVCTCVVTLILPWLQCWSWLAMILTLDRHTHWALAPRMTLDPDQWPWLLQSCWPSHTHTLHWILPLASYLNPMLGSRSQKSAQEVQMLCLSERVNQGHNETLWRLSCEYILLSGMVRVCTCTCTNMCK